MSLKKAREEADRRGVGSYQRHIFLCVGPDCCSPEEGQHAWNRLKKRLADLDHEGAVYRTKASCLRICTQGPTAVVYPEGAWYAGLDDDALDRVITEHLLGGRPVEDHIIGNNPLPRSESSDIGPRTSDSPSVSPP